MGAVKEEWAKVALRMFGTVNAETLAKAKPFAQAELSGDVAVVKMRDMLGRGLYTNAEPAVKQLVMEVFRSGYEAGKEDGDFGEGFEAGREEAQETYGEWHKPL